jgi:hypothetical protein
MQLNFAEASNRANASSLGRMASAVPDGCGVLGGIEEEGLSVSVSIDVLWLMTVLVLACGLCAVVVFRAGRMVPQEWSDSKNVTLANGKVRTESTSKRGSRAFQGQAGAVAQRAAARSQSNVRRRELEQARFPIRAPGRCSKMTNWKTGGICAVKHSVRRQSRTVAPGERCNGVGFCQALSAAKRIGRGDATVVVAVAVVDEATRRDAIDGAWGGARRGLLGRR